MSEDATQMLAVWIVEVAEDGTNYEMSAAAHSETDACRLAEELMRWPYAAARVRRGKQVIAVYKRTWSGKVVAAGNATIGRRPVDGKEM